MSIIYKCDRCGEHFEEFPRHGESEFRIYRYGKEIPIALHADICPKCYEEFQEWMKKKPEPVVIKGDFAPISEALKRCVDSIYPTPVVTVEVKPKKKRRWRK